MSKKIVISLFIVVVLLTYCGYKFIEIKMYKSYVDLALYKKLVENNKNVDQYQKDISFFYGDDKNYEPKPIIWNGKMFRVRHADNPVVHGETTYSDSNTVFNIIETRDNENGDWITFVRESGNFCDELFSNGKNLLCIVSGWGKITLNIINADGNFITKTLISTPNDIGQSFFLDGKTLYFVFTDDRFVWNLPIPVDAPHQFGTQLLMAGQLNIDTLDFKQSVIGYADVKFYDGYSNTILLPSIAQGDGVRRIEKSGAFVHD